MKTGDPKQVVGLGIVAFIAIGFLGKTLFGAFGGENAARPVVVQELRGGTKADVPVQPVQSPTGGTNTSLPKTEVNSSSDYQGPTYVIRDAFAKPPARTQAFPGSDQGEMVKGSGSLPFGNETIPPIDPGFTGQAEAQMPTKPTKEQIKSEIKKPETPKEAVATQIKVKLRFDGFVDAGSPMAVVSIEGKSFNIGVGEILINGYKVEAISDDKITVRKNKETKTIYIGRETEF